MSNPLENIDFSRFFSLSDNLLCILNTSFILEDCNDSIIPVLSYNKDEVIGCNFLEYVFEADIGQTKQKLDQVIHSQLNDKIELVCLFKNGLDKYVYIQWNFCYDKDNGHIYAVGRDISLEMKNERKLNNYKSRFKELQSIAKLGTWEMDVRNRSMYWSDTMYILFKRKKRSGPPTFRDFINSVVEDDRMALIEAVENSITNNKSYEVEVRHKNEDGDLIYVIARGIPMEKGGYVKKLFGTVLDITKQKKAEEDLLISKLEVEKLVRIKQQFLANMSHEIRTPLNAIIGFTDILSESNHLQEANKKQVNSIKQSGDHLLGIVNDILDFTKIEEGGIFLELTAINLEEQLKNTYTKYKVLADKRGLNFELDIAKDVPNYVFGDALRLQQVIGNLVSNAFKYTVKGTVAVKVIKVREDDGRAVLKISIIDSGIGIPVNEVNTIFDSFTQVSIDTARKYGGTGLGLTIVKHIVDLHGGKIEVKSKLTKGTAFEMTIPYKLASSEDLIVKQALPEEEIDIEGWKILLLEDNKMNQALTKNVVTRWGASIDIADDGLVGLAYIKENNYDLVLMDLAMPKMDAYTCISCIRELNNDKSKIPVMAMTAHAFESEIQKCKELGFNDYISKPFRKKELKAKIYSMVMEGGAFAASSRSRKMK